jgi:four helix bundle protein
MAKIERFEDIQGWQKGRELCKLVYQVTNKGTFSRDYGLRDQIRRAATSVVSNIAEGFESQSDQTFIRYLYIAKGSSGEVRAQSYVALDQGYITRPEFDSLYKAASETSRLISGFIQYLEKNT